MDVLNRADLLCGNRCLTFSVSFPTTRPARPTWKRRAGLMASPVVLRRRGRAFPHRHPSRRPDLPGLPPPDRLDCGHDQRAQLYAVERLFLGGVSGRQLNAGHVGGVVPTAAGLSRYETAFGILHKLRAGMVRPDRDRIGGKADGHIEVDEAYVGGRKRGEGRGVHHKTLVIAAVEVRNQEAGTHRISGRMAATPGASGWLSWPTGAQSRCAASSRAP